MATTTAPDQRAAIGDPLLVSLAGVAELAQVSRSVASMWRARLTSGFVADSAFKHDERAL